MSTYGTWDGVAVTNVKAYENLLLNYIFAQWTETNPKKGATMEEYDKEDVSKVIFKPGYPSNNRHYQLTIRRISTVPIEKPQTRGHWIMEIILAIHTKARRLSRPKSEPLPGIPEQIENMEQEVERILQESKIGSIPNVMKLEYIGNERVYAGDDSFMKSEWESITGAKMWIDKMTTSPPV